MTTLKAICFGSENIPFLPSLRNFSQTASLVIFPEAIFFAFFAAILCALSGQELLSAKAAKKFRKDREERQSCWRKV
jgi:hypothetical protein